MQLKSEYLNDDFAQEFVHIIDEKYKKHIEKFDIKLEHATGNILIFILYNSKDVVITVTKDMTIADIFNSLMQALLDTFPEDFI